MTDLNEKPATGNGKANTPAAPAVPTARPRIRALTPEELQRWTQAIYLLCRQDGESGTGYSLVSKHGWVPQLRAAYAHLMPFVDEQSRTACTDCRYRVGLAPALLDPDKTPIEQLAMLVLHETMHNTQGHRERLLERKGLDGKLTNFATDLEINGVIAQGVLGIDLSYPESRSNGHWEELWGTLEMVDDKLSREVNAADENGNLPYGRIYQPGSWIYRGLLLPGHGQFSDFLPGGTAEQYLAFLEVETESMTIDQFMQSRSPQPSDGDGEVCGHGGSSDGGNGSNSGNTGGGSEDGSRGDGPSSPDQNDGEKGDMSDGFGGQITDTGDGHVSVTHIYKRNADGTRTEVGRDALVDDIGAGIGQDVWDEVSKLGIHPLSRGEEQKVKDQIAHEIEVHRRGDSYGSERLQALLSYVEQGLRPPIINWKKALSRVVSHAVQQQVKGRDDYTYRRPNRRHAAEKLIYPGMTSYVPTIRFALDTSASMSAAEYFNALSEASGVLKNSKAKIEFVCWDGEAGDIKKVRSVSEMQEQLTGGGGTLAGAPFRQAAKQKPRERPDVIVCATDGCFDWDELADALGTPGMERVIPIILVVYPFTENEYYAKQGELAKHQTLLRQHHPKAQVLQAWSKLPGKGR